MRSTLRNGPNLFVSLLEEISDVHTPLPISFIDKVDYAYRIFTNEIFELIVINDQKQVKKELIAIRNELINEIQVLAIEVIDQFDPNWRDTKTYEKNWHAFRCKMAYMSLDKLDLIIDFLFNYKSMPGMPKEL